MNLPFIDRYPTSDEIKKLRLLLSTFLDGSGGNKNENNDSISSFPNYKDFERCIALTFCGYAPEGKAVFDVILEDLKGIKYGISCKMKGDDAWAKLDFTKNIYPFIHMELSNASGDFNKAIEDKGISLNNYLDGDNPTIAGNAVVDLVKSWHDKLDKSNSGDFDVSKSFFLVMVYETKTLKCSLFQIPLSMPSSKTVRWCCPLKKYKDKMVPSKRIQGDVDQLKIFDFYGTSGGQLKYYYPLEWPIFWSTSFQLESVPDEHGKHDIFKKAQLYFPDAWKEIEGS
jgi:hypothetical protein